MQIGETLLRWVLCNTELMAAQHLLMLVSCVQLSCHLFRSTLKAARRCKTLHAAARGLRLEETRVEKMYIGQRANSAIQYHKPSFNTYYSWPFSQSGHLKPSSFRKQRGGACEWREGRGLVIFTVETSLQSAEEARFPVWTLTSRHAPTNESFSSSAS